MADVIAFGGVGAALLLATRIAEPAITRLVQLAKERPVATAAVADVAQQVAQAVAAVRAEERLDGVKEALREFHDQHVDELRQITTALQALIAAADRIAFRVDAMSGKLDSVAVAVADTRQVTREVKAIVERRERRGNG